MLPVFGRWVLTPGRLNVLAATTTLVRTSVGKDREEVPPSPLGQRAAVV